MEIKGSLPAPPVRPLDAIPRSAIPVALGAAIALALHFATCGIFDMGVHLLAHECLGHAVSGWAMGRLAIPGVWATTWSEPSRFIEVLILLALVGGAYKLYKEERRALAIGLAASAFVYPFLAFTNANELLCIAGGHLGEIGWGAFFFYRAVRGGYFQDQERPLYAALGWFLFTNNVLLFFRLATSGPYRAAYESVSLVEGVENDYVRVAETLHMSLARVSGFMTVVALLVPPLGGLLAWWQGREDAASSRQ